MTNAGMSSSAPSSACAAMTPLMVRSGARRAGEETERRRLEPFACLLSVAEQRVDERTVAAAPPFVDGIPVVEREARAGGIAPVRAGGGERGEHDGGREPVLGREVGVPGALRVGFGAREVALGCAGRGCERRGQRVVGDVVGIVSRGQSLGEECVGLRQRAGDERHQPEAGHAPDPWVRVGQPRRERRGRREALTRRLGLDAEEVLQAACEASPS